MPQPTLIKQLLLRMTKEIELSNSYGAHLIRKGCYLTKGNLFLLFLFEKFVGTLCNFLLMPV